MSDVSRVASALLPQDPRTLRASRAMVQKAHCRGARMSVSFSITMTRRCLRLMERHPAAEGDHAQRGPGSE